MLATIFALCRLNLIANKAIALTKAHAIAYLLRFIMSSLHLIKAQLLEQPESRPVCLGAYLFKFVVTSVLYESLYNLLSDATLVVFRMDA